MADVTCSANEVIEACQTISRFSESATGTSRPFLCKAMRGCHAYLSTWMNNAGMDVTVDHAGNLRGFYRGTGDRRLVIGSHLDTVPNAGAYDGILGVVLGVALIDSLQGRRLPFGIEVIGFSEEEGVRFRLPFIGSRAFTGTLNDDFMSRTDADGVTIENAIRTFGLDPSRLGDCIFDPNTFAYLEFHIEQGPVLESLNKPLAVVESIAGQTRAWLTFTGKANHAGTTPMHLRSDALAAAAEWIGFVEQAARTTAGLVATVGQIHAVPGAGNVIAGEVGTSLDVRHASDAIRETALLKILDEAHRIGQSRGIIVSANVRVSQPAVTLNSTLVQTAAKALNDAGFHAPKLVSGAGHDAMIVAEKIPSVMIFLRSPGGISHHPDEHVLLEDVEATLSAGRCFLESLSA